jgi:glutamate dehydrogenase
MQALEAEGLLERAIEFLPSGEEMAERRRSGRGMARPELAVLLAYAKQSLAHAILSSTLPDSDYLAQDLRSYFPPAIVERFGDRLVDHPLRRELIATLVSNDVVNSQGITFVSRLVAETGAEAADVVRAYRIARDVTGSVKRWEEVERLVGGLAPAIVDDLMRGIDHVVEITARWYLQHAPGQLGRAIEAHREPFAEFEACVWTVAPEAWRQQREREAWTLMDKGVPEEIARRHAMQPFLIHGPNIVSVAAEDEAPIADVTRAFFLVGEAGYVDWLEARVREIPATTRWHRWALMAVGDDLLAARRKLAEQALAHAESVGVDEAVERYLASNEEVRGRLARFMRALALEDVSDLAAVTVAVRQIRALAG